MLIINSISFTNLMLIYNAVRGCQGDAGVSSWADHLYWITIRAGYRDKTPMTKLQHPKP